ncbi:MAG: hypothetical protein JSV78_02125 [Phycisphaerales bacterium]|nr:MAG: hypothetical protein JSV78_02125 [Phycisphaerales bacterium]
MTSKFLGLLIFCFWAASMGWLVAHDVWPAISAQDVPVLRATEWLESEGRESQAGIFDQSGRIGTAWTTYLIDDVRVPVERARASSSGSSTRTVESTSIIRSDLIIIDRFPLPVTPLRVKIDSTFNPKGELDEFTLRLRAQDREIKMHGERFHADFSFELEAGPKEYFFKIPLSDAGTITGAFSPFAQLPDLQVGQSWRMQVFNPLSAVAGVGDRFIPMLAQVTGRENITLHGVVRSCLVVEAAGAKAWVDRHGVVLRQETSLPVGGTITIIREPFDEESRDRAMGLFRMFGRPRR